MNKIFEKPKKARMKTVTKQFIRNMVVGTFYSLFWYGSYRLIPSFWFATIVTNTLGFFAGRYWIFREGVKG